MKRLIVVIEIETGEPIDWFEDEAEACMCYSDREDEVFFGVFFAD